MKKDKDISSKMKKDDDFEQKLSPSEIKAREEQE